MKQYKDLIQKILTEGEERIDRTGVGTKAIFGHQLKFDLTQGFPLVSLKKTVWRSAFYEMIWFLRGDTNIKYLHDRGIKIWDQWADENGSIGPGYGVSLRKWAAWDFDKYNNIWPIEIDQVQNFINQLKINLFSRRHIMTTWHVARVNEMNLPVCHGLVIQGYISNPPANGIIYEPGPFWFPFFDLHIYQRSCDTILGLPFNIAEWAFFMYLIGELCGLVPRNLIFSLGDAHIYSNHLEGVQKMMKRDPIEQQVQLIIKKKLQTLKDIENLEIDTDVEILNYNFHPFIKFEVAV